MYISARNYPEPKLSQFLFASRRMAPVWTVVRLYLGYLWLKDGLLKVQSPLWVGPEAGAVTTSLLTRSLTLTAGEHPSVPLWYAWVIEHMFLPNALLFSNLLAVGAVLIGLALICGFLTGITAFIAGSLNASYLMAGIVFSGPTMFILATWLVLAWRVAGYYGLDYWLLPKLGAPRGEAFDQEAASQEADQGLPGRRPERELLRFDRPLDRSKTA